MKEYLVLSRTNNITRNGSPYAVLKVADKEEIINLSVWDLQPTAAPVVGQIVSFSNIKDNAGKKSCGLLDLIVKEIPTSDHPLYGLIPRPITRKEWDVCIERLIGFCKDNKLTPIIKDFADKLFKPYSEYPAATSVHHAYPGGLLNHTYQMLHMLEGLYPCLPYPIKVERSILAILFHDYGKVYEYNRQG